MNNRNKQVTECIREFKLRQQYPSMIKKAKNVGKMVVINASLKSLIPVTTKLTSKTNIQAKKEFQKLRLKLPSGKDLGEFNVRILPNNNGTLEGKTVTLMNQNKCKTLNKPMILSNISENKRKKMVPITSLQSMNSTIQTNVLTSPNSVYLNEISCNLKNNSVDASDSNAKYQSQIISLKSADTNGRCHEGRKNTSIENMDTDIITDNGCNENGGAEHNNVESKLMHNKNSLQSISNILSDTNILENSKQSINTNSSSKLSKYLSFPRSIAAANINDSTVPLIEVPCHSVNQSGIIAGTVEKHSNTDNSESQKDSLLNEKNKVCFLPMEDENVNLSLEQKRNTVDLKFDNYNLDQNNVNVTCNKSILEQKKIVRENVMVIVHDNGTSLLNNGITTKHKINDIPVINKNHNIHNDDMPVVKTTSSYKNLRSQTGFPNTIQFNGNQYNMVQNIDNPSKENHANENVSSQKTCSNCSVLKEIMKVIKNENLKVKVLKAFADCCTEIEQQNPSDLPKHTKTVCDTIVQTDLYSLLETENFLNVKEDMSSAPKMMPNESYFANTPENCNVNPLNYMPYYENSIFSPFNQSQELDMFLHKCIDGNVIDDICNKHSTANKVKEVLLQPNVSCNKISEQLRRDFETVRKWDENGMLNIHKAVISNRVYDVQRHLMVLKACNVNVDTPTQSGMTSLELAIKHNTSTEIVKLLLEAGANPASFQPIHDSALILASKASSSFLPELINNVPSSKLLDYVDFTGFAALHYCVQYGNLEGVNSLINRGANINLQESRSGRTPLFLSIENDYPVIAQKLIENGAQADIPNFSGQTVMSLAGKIKHLSVITLLHTER